MGESSAPHGIDLRVVDNGDAIARSGATLVAQIAREAIDRRGICRIALAGGRTPQGVYERLASGEHDGPEVDWARVVLFFGDERHVPPGHPDSNFRMASEALVGRVPVPASQVHRMRTEEEDAVAAAADYERTLRASFGLAPGEWPRFDLVLLGMGRDGHTASLFPHTPVLHEAEHLASAVWVPSLQTWRVTITLPVINHARAIVVLAGGAEKAPALRAVLAGGADPGTYPLAGVRPVDGRMIWIVDAEAAGQGASA
ncbi:MAG TPA: 6-phosphogluconolactonase [Vicinamibacterales bacterium]